MRENASSATGTLLETSLLPQELFLRMLHLEQRRADRSKSKFVLLLIDIERLPQGGIESILRGLAPFIEEIDVTGWYKTGAVIGTIFTEIDQTLTASTFLDEVRGELSSTLSDDAMKGIRLSSHLFPADLTEQGVHRGKEAWTRRFAFMVKRAMDVTCSLTGLILISPVLLTVAILIKATSKGPVLFRQQRVGQYGTEFMFLKFRSMQWKNNEAIHVEFVKAYITGVKNEREEADQEPAVYKLTKDPRLTPVGGFLRRTSLDELPQLFNVLKGEMSLVGPRPPIPYEVSCYETWHKRRLLSVKPGITGLWQVTERSRVKFDDMVRLDLKYARTWSLWLDIKILLKTPGAVINGSGAY